MSNVIRWKKFETEQLFRLHFKVLSQAATYFENLKLANYSIEINHEFLVFRKSQTVAIEFFIVVPILVDKLIRDILDESRNLLDFAAIIIV